MEVEEGTNGFVVKLKKGEEVWWCRGGGREETEDQSLLPASHVLGSTQDAAAKFIQTLAHNSHTQHSPPTTVHKVPRHDICSGTHRTRAWCVTVCAFFCLFFGLFQKKKKNRRSFGLYSNALLTVLSSAFQNALLLETPREVVLED